MAERASTAPIDPPTSRKRPSKTRPRNASAAFPPLAPRNPYKAPNVVAPTMEPGPSRAVAAAAAAFAAIKQRSAAPPIFTPRRAHAIGACEPSASSAKALRGRSSATASAQAFNSCRPSSRFANFALADSWPVAVLPQAPAAGVTHVAPASKSRMTSAPNSARAPLPASHASACRFAPVPQQHSARRAPEPSPSSPLQPTPPPSPRRLARAASSRASSRCAHSSHEQSPPRAVSPPPSTYQMLWTAERWRQIVGPPPPPPPHVSPWRRPVLALGAAMALATPVLGSGSDHKEARRRRRRQRRLLEQGRDEGEHSGEESSAGESEQTSDEDGARPRPQSLVRRMSSRGIEVQAQDGAAPASPRHSQEHSLLRRMASQTPGG